MSRLFGVAKSLYSRSYSFVNYQFFSPQRHSRPLVHLDTITRYKFASRLPLRVTF